MDDCASKDRIPSTKAGGPCKLKRVADPSKLSCHLNSTKCQSPDAAEQLGSLFGGHRPSTKVSEL